MTFAHQINRIIGRIFLRRVGTKSRRIIIVGDSHADAFEQAVALRKNDSEFEQVEVYRFAKRKGDISIGNISFEAFLKVAATLNRDDFIFSAIGGNQYAVISTVEHPLGLEVMAGPKDKHVYLDDAMLIPNRIVSDYLYHALQTTVGSKLEAIKGRTSAQLIHLAPPPPKGDNEFIARYFEQRFGELGMSKYGPTKPDLRLKVWKIQLAAIERLCGELGVSVLAPPTHTTDKSGFLDSRYYAKDATHANRRYGREAIKQILDFVGGPIMSELRAASAESAPAR